MTDYDILGIVTIGSAIGLSIAMWLDEMVFEL